MPLFKNGRFVDDPWLFLADGEPLPGEGMVVVSLARLLGSEAPALADRDGWLGVSLAPAEPVEKLRPWLPRLALVALAFPVFTDGRPFSTARLLRERYGFTGEIRAVGQVLVDQYPFMVRSGFDAFAVPRGSELRGWQERARPHLVYQPDGRGEAPSIWRLRHPDPGPASPRGIPRMTTA